jgi:hypothetical protein
MARVAPQAQKLVGVDFVREVRDGTRALVTRLYSACDS